MFPWVARGFVAARHVAHGTGGSLTVQGISSPPTGSFGPPVSRHPALAPLALPTMHPRRRPRLHLSLATAICAVMVLTVGPVGAQSIEDARRERNQIQARLDAAAEDLAALEARIGGLDDETQTLEARMQALAAEADEAEQRVADRIREMYKRGIDTPVLQLLSGDDATAALERAELAGHLLAGDRVEIEEAVAARTRATEVADQLDASRADLDAARAEQEAVLEELRADLDRAAALEERLVEEERQRQEEARRRAQAAKEAAEARAAEEARREAAEQAQQAEAAEAQAAPSTPTAAPAAPSSGGRACPVGQPHSFTDTWGAPRSGGRSHKGVDILANYGTPVYAIVDGQWDVRAYGNLAGNWAILRGNDGNTYYYMHLQSHTVGDGASVTAGTQTGTIGDTGNARGTPHLHFEYHPGGGGAANPYPITRAAC